MGRRTPTRNFTAFNSQRSLWDIAAAAAAAAAAARAERSELNEMPPLQTQSVSLTRVEFDKKLPRITSV